MNRLRNSSLVVIFLMLFILGSYYSSQAKKMESVSVLSDQGMGLSFFNELGAKLHPKAIQYLKKPLLKSDQLSGIDLYIVMSPGRPLSEHESAILASYVTNGGNILLSFHSFGVESPFGDLFKRLKISVPTEEDDSFENDKTVIKPSDQNTILLDRARSYELYSNFFLKDEEGIASYIKTVHIGSGSISIIAGLPPIINALIDRKENRFIAYKILGSFHSILIDEYQHFFSDKTMWDLFTEPTFFLPIFGMIIAAILFFLFGRANRNEAFSQIPPPLPVLSYHTLNERVLCGLASKFPSRYELFVYHADMLQRLFPGEQDRIASVLKRAKSAPQDMRIGQALIQLHFQILSERMRLS